MKTKSNAPSSAESVCSAGPTRTSIRSPSGERSNHDWAKCARSGETSQVTIRPPSGSPPAIARAE